MRFLFLLLVAFTISAQAQTEKLQELLSAVEAHGLSSSWYQTDELQNAIDSGDQARIAKVTSGLILKVSQDLNRGRLSTAAFGRKVRIKAKNFEKTALVNEFIKGQRSAADLVQQLAPQNIGYQQLLRMFTHFKQIETSGNWMQPTPGTNFTALKMGSTNMYLIRYLRVRLSSMGYENIFANPTFDQELADLVKLFQDDHKMKADGVVGPQTWKIINTPLEQLTLQIALNLDRMRWLPDQAASEFVFVNLADQQGQYYANHELRLSFKTINGRLDRQTPLLVDSITSLVLNPTWTVPFSIFIKDKLPEIKNDVSYIDRLNMKVIDDVSGREVDPSSIDWSSQNSQNLRYTLIQRPGPWNALGFVKFPLQNPYAIYLHDTNDRHLFAENPRLLSSGCVRVEKPYELAESIMTNQQWTVDSLKQATEFLPQPPEQQQWLKTPRTVPVYITYITLAQKDGRRVVILPDAYGIDKLAAAAFQTISKP